MYKKIILNKFYCLKVYMMEGQIANFHLNENERGELNKWRSLGPSFREYIYIYICVYIYI